MEKSKIGLMKCALKKHEYGDPVKDKKLQRLVKVCVHCGDKVVLSSESLGKIQSRKMEIIEALNKDNYCHAKSMLNRLMKEFGY